MIYRHSLKQHWFYWLSCDHSLSSLSTPNFQTSAGPEEAILPSLHMCCLPGSTSCMHLHLNPYMAIFQVLTLKLRYSESLRCNINYIFSLN